jgi:PAS domain S-box-containing protein
MTEPRSQNSLSIESEYLFNLVVENVKDFAIFVTDLNGTIISWNPGVKNILGYEEKEFIGQHCSLIFTEEDIKNGQPQKEMEDALRYGKGEDNRWHLRKDRTIFWANGLLMPLKERNGRVVGFTKILRDNTHTKRLEQQIENHSLKLEEQSHTLNDILESITDGFLALDDRWQITYFNRRAEQLLHKTREEVLGRDIREVFPAASGKVVFEQYQRAFNQQTKVNFEVFYPPLNAWVEIHLYPSPKGLSIYFQDITTRKKSELTLKESEQRFRLAAACATDLIYEWDIGENSIQWFGNVDERLGYKAGEFSKLHGSWEKSLHPDDHDRVLQVIQESLRTCRPFKTEYRIRRKDGAYLYWTDCGQIILNEEGRAYKWIGVNTDITQQHQTLEALKESEEQLRLMLENIVDYAIFMIDQEGRVKTWNRAAEMVTGWKEEEVVGRDYNILHTAEHAASGGPLKELEIAKTKGVFKGEGWRVRSNGFHFWAKIVLASIYDEDGKLFGFVKVIQDLTEKRQTETALRLSEEKFRNLIEHASDAIFIADPERNYVDVNSSACSMLGYSYGELIRKSIADLIPKEDIPKLEAAKRSLLNGDKYIEEWRLIRKDGSSVPVEVSAKILPDRRWQAIVRDITDRRRAEEERIQILEREQQARHEAEEANRLKDEFLATLSHELRTPLTSILGWARMLNTGQLDQEQQERAIETIARNAKAQSQIIEDILDISRLITGKLRLNIRPFDIRSVVESSINTIRPSAEAKGINLHYQFPAKVSPVWGDYDRLQQVVWNLLTNATKFTPEGGEVKIEVTEIDNHMEIRVRDTGIGIKQDLLPYIFERFRQADSSTTRRHGGLGLGLAIVKHLVELHGGTVQAYSEGEGKGTTFTIRLSSKPISQQPAIIDGSEERRKRQSIETKKIEFAKELKGLKVLVVDDEDSTREIVKVILETCGVKVVTAESASEAFDRLQGETIDVLLSDLSMPDEDGYSLIKRVRELPKEHGGDIPAAALTAYARAEDRVKVLSSGFQIHVPKPIEPAELITVVAHLAAARSKTR